MTNELFLDVAGKSVHGWQSIRVTRGIERLPSDFDIAMMDYYPGSDEQQLVTPGDECVVRLGDDVVLTGYVDRWEGSIAPGSHEIRVTGRSKCMDLVDCSAIWPNNVLEGMNAYQIASRLAEHYGISVQTDVDNLTTVPLIMLSWGETAQEITERACRADGLLYYDLPDGSLILTRVSDKQAASGVAQGQNIQ
ncbi:MAG: phage baseplate assembly protein, partial [Enterobacteriaceae bacterium]